MDFQFHRNLAIQSYYICFSDILINSTTEINVNNILSFSHTDVGLICIGQLPSFTLLILFIAGKISCHVGALRIDFFFSG
jgi:hypothetical protein